MGLILRLEADAAAEAVMCEMMRMLSDESGGVSENAFYRLDHCERFVSV